MGLKKRYNSSDCGALGNIHDEKGFAKSAQDVVTDVMQAGIYILECYHHFLAFLYVIMLITITKRYK